MSKQNYEGYAIVEIMGHRVRAGHVVMDESPTIRIEIPLKDSEQTVTEFYGRAAIFSLRPCTEEIAKDCAYRYADPRPVRPLAYREADEPRRLEQHHSDEFEEDFGDE